MLNLPSLKFRRVRGDLMQAYKIFNNKDEITLENTFELSKCDITRHCLFKIFIYRSKTNRKRYAFNNRVAIHWNPLANTTKTAKDINSFKNFLVNERKINLLKFDND